MSIPNSILFVILFLCLVFAVTYSWVARYMKLPWSTKSSRDNTLQHLTDENTSLLTEIATARQAILDFEQRKRDDDALYALLSNRLDEANSLAGGLQTEVEHYRARLQRLTWEKDGMNELLQVRTRELESAQAFLSKSDKYSGGEVVKMVKDLNSEIFQAAANIAEWYDGEPKGEELSELELALARDHVSKLLGSRMADDLFRLKDSTVVQMAFQAVMCGFSKWVITSWCYGDKEKSKILRDVYKSILQIEEHSIAGRWRVLTRSTVQGAASDFATIQAPFYDAFVTILMCAGLNRNEKELRSIFLDRVDNVIKCAMTLNTVVGEGVTSCELIPMYCSPNVTFDEERMENDYHRSGLQGEFGDIFCTTGLGLWRSEKMDGGKWNNSSLLKPRVALQSVLNEI